MRWSHPPFGEVDDEGASSLGKQSGDRRQRNCAHACDRMHVRSDDKICVHVRVCPHESGGNFDDLRIYPSGAVSSRAAVRGGAAIEDFFSGDIVLCVHRVFWR